MYSWQMRNLSVLVLALAASLCAQDGSALYRQHCASCHDGGVGRAPQPAALKQMSPENVQFALKTGAMARQGGALTQQEIVAVSEFVTGQVMAKEVFAKQAFCADAPAPLDEALAQPHWNGWGVDSSNRRFQPPAMAQLAASDVPSL